MPEVAVPIPPARAKVNLGLEVLGRMTTGLHAMQSVICPLSLSDTLQLTLYPGCPERQDCQVMLSAALLQHCEAAKRSGFLEDRSIASLQGPENLACKAITAFLNTFCASQDYGFSLQIDKSIPFQAGLGGGSANAAAVLRGLATWYGLALEEAKLLEIAGKLGADVPALLFDEMVAVEGTGRIVHRFCRRQGSSKSTVDFLVDSLKVLVVKPLEGMSTAMAYQLLERKEQQYPQEYLNEITLIRQNLILQPKPRFTALCQRLFPGGEQLIFGETQARALTYTGQEGRCLSPELPSGADTTEKALCGFGFYNDFESVHEAANGQVAQLLNSMRESDLFDEVVLSGSGSAVVGVLKTTSSGSCDEQQFLQKLPEGWFVAEAELLLGLGDS